MCVCLSQVFPSNHVKTALHTVFKSNVMGFADGNMGAINGTRPDGKKDITSCQSEEFWTGVTSALSAQMVQEVHTLLLLLYISYHFYAETVLKSN